MKIIDIFSTANAERYMTQLLKHFAHKIDVQINGAQGHAQLPIGPAEFEATPTELRVTITLTDPEAEGRAKAVIDDHLARFAFREEFKNMDWRVAAEG